MQNLIFWPLISSKICSARLIICCQLKLHAGRRRRRRSRLPAYLELPPARLRLRLWFDACTCYGGKSYSGRSDLCPRTGAGNLRTAGTIQSRRAQSTFYAGSRLPSSKETAFPSPAKKLSLALALALKLARINVGSSAQLSAATSAGSGDGDLISAVLPICKQ